MSRKQGLLIIFVIALVLALGLHLLAGGSSGPGVDLPAILGKTLGLFIFPGVLPCIVWACMKFRRERLRAIMGSWIALQILFVAASYIEYSHAAFLG
jgi:hypothetical protein